MILISIHWNICKKKTVYKHSCEFVWITNISFNFYVFVKVKYLHEKCEKLLSVLKSNKN